jgi:hypothetical protein
VRRTYVCFLRDEFAEVGLIKDGGILIRGIVAMDWWENIRLRGRSGVIMFLCACSMNFEFRRLSDHASSRKFSKHFRPIRCFVMVYWSIQAVPSDVVRRSMSQVLSGLRQIALNEEFD